jgi:cell division protein FtsB
MNDGYISSLNRIIDMFVAESEHVNDTLNLQKAQFRELKNERTQIKRERRTLKEEIASEMRENKQY